MAEPEDPPSPAIGLAPVRRSASTPDDSLALLEKYRWDAQYLSAGHYLHAKRVATQGTRIAVLAIVSASIAGTSAFASLAAEGAVGWKIATGILASAAAAFAALQSSLKLDERAAQHKDTGARFTEIRDDADRLLVALRNVEHRGPEEMIDEVAAIAGRMTTLARLAPDLPNETYDEARAGFEPTPSAQPQA